MAEVLRSSEHLGSPTGYDGMKGRLILKDQKFLNPAETAPNLETNLSNTASFEERNYKVFGNASRSERTDYWQREKKIDGFDNQYRAWSQSTIKTFTSAGNKERVAKLGKLMHKIGVDTSSFNDAQAKALYDRYFSDESDSDAGVKKFVKDLLETYTVDGKVDHAQITADTEGIQWLSNIFGKNSSEIISQLAVAEAELKSAPDNIVNKSNEAKDNISRMNNLNKREKELLEFLTRHAAGLPTSDTTGEGDGAPKPEPEKTTENGESPVRQHAKEIIDAIKNNDQIILIGTTGSGKTTETPLLFLESIMEEGDKLAITQPLKQITQSTAERIAEVHGSKLGKIIGYKHGDSKRLEDDTKVNVIVEGSFLRMLLEDPMLSDYNYVMVDEVHQRGKNTDSILGYLVRAQQLRLEHIEEAKRKGETPKYKPLKIIASSATIEPKDLAPVLPRAKVIEVPGRTYKIDEHWRNTDVDPKQNGAIVSGAVQQVQEIVNSKIDPAVPSRDDGGMIIFMPGKRMIDAAVKQIEDKIRAGELPANTIVFPFYSGLPRQKRDEALRNYPGKRVIIVATNAIETGLTPKSRIIHTIDSGQETVSTYDAALDMEFIDVVACTEASRLQRRGRVGRREDGHYWALFTEATARSRTKSKPPEITNSNLTDIVLLMKRMEHDIDTFSWVTKPPAGAVGRAVRTLQTLGALNPDGSINDTGYDMAMLPVDARMARVVVESKRRGCLRDGVAIACLSQAESIFRMPHFKETARFQEAERVLAPFKDSTSDFMTLLNIWNEYDKLPKGKDNREAREKWANDHFLNFRALEEAANDIRYIMSLMTDTAKSKTRFSGTNGSIKECIISGYSDRVLEKKGVTYVGPTANPKRFAVYGSPSGVPINGTSIRIEIDNSSSLPIDGVDRIIMAQNNPNKKVWNGVTTISAQLCQAA